jgi:hypothetical protein
MEPPKDTSELKAELDRLRQDRLARKAAREATSSSSSAFADTGQAPSLAPCHSSPLFL